jgi:hypothetical protein
MGDNPTSDGPDRSSITPETPPVGEALKATQAGSLPIGTVEQILEAAPSDLIEETIPIPEWGCSVKLRSFTAAQAAMIKEESFQTDDDGKTSFQWAEGEIKQFQMGVVEPAFDEEQVRRLHLSSGRGFAKVIAWLDDKSSIDRKELKKTREEFRGSQESPAV